METGMETTEAPPTKIETENYYLYIRESLYRDFDKLLHAYRELGTVRFEQFAQKWREMRFSFLFYGHQSEQELREFTEEAFKQAWKFFTAQIQSTSTSSFLNQVGAIYLLYSLYTKQLCKPKVKIRVSMENVNMLNLLLEKMKNQKHFDFVYIVTKLKVEGAFHFVFTSNQMYIHMKASGTKKSMKATPNQAEMLEAETIDQLSAIHEQYYQMKCALAGEGATGPDASLNIVKMDLVQNITKCVTNFQEQVKKSNLVSKQKKKDAATSESEYDSVSETEQQAIATSPQNTRASVRAKAYSQGVTSSRSRRHRHIQVEDSDSSPQKKEKKVKSPDKKTKRNKAPEDETETGDVGGSDDHAEPLLSMPELTSPHQGDQSDGRAESDEVAEEDYRPQAKSSKKSKSKKTKNSPRKGNKRTVKSKARKRK